MSSKRPRSPRSLTKAQLIEDIQERLAPRIAELEEENKRLRERLASAETLGPGVSGKQDVQELRRALAEALDQQTATAEILRAISKSPTDYQPVFDTIVRNASGVCRALDSAIFLADGTETVLVAHHDPMRLFEIGRRVPIRADTVNGRTILEARTIHVDDLANAPDFESGQAAARRFGYRTVLGVPLLRDAKALGMISTRRADVRPFTGAQIKLLETFADQAVIAIENVRLFTALQASNRELTTALATQTATSDILRVISRSQTDVQPVFDAILASAVRLLGAYSGSLTRSAGDQIELAALTSTGDAGDAAVRARYPQPLQSEDPQALTLRDRAPFNIADAQTDPRLPEATHAYARARGWRSAVMVPILRHGEAVGTISLTRRDPGGFTDDEIALVKTFADQAVIATENVRLFTELQTSNRELTTALDTQTATSDILRVISQSHTNIQPVFDAIVGSAVRLLRARSGTLSRIVGDHIDLAAHTSTDDAGDAATRAAFPQPIHFGGVHAQAIRNRAPLNVADAHTDARLPEATQKYAQVRGYRSQIVVPMLRYEEAVGAIAVTRRDPGGFTDDEIALLKTFADQAVIAIENARLFSELQDKNCALTAAHAEVTQALDRQTATSGVLRAISQSQTDVGPVFEAIVDSAVRLLRAYTGSLTRVVGDEIVLAAFTRTDPAGDTALQARFPVPVASNSSHALALRDRAPLNVADAEADPRLSDWAHGYARVRGYRSQLVVPLLRQADAIGTISVTRREPGGFEADEIALIQTFADQAVIAVENARLFNELQERTAALTRSVGQLTALGDVGRAVSSSLDLDTVLTTILSRAVQLSATDGGTIFEWDDNAAEFSARATLNADEGQSAMLRETRLRRGEGAVGQMAVTLEPLQIPDISAEGAYESRLRGAMLAAGTRSVLAIPLLQETRLVGGLVVTRRAPGAFTSDAVNLLQTFATQSALAIQNARLFREVESKSRQLAAASQHKSEFLANMSHELRTPLNAIIGYSEMLQEEAQDGHQDSFIPDLERINAAAKHQLELINDILDLSKVEAGKMELELTNFHLPTAIDNALTLVRERAARRGIMLQATIDGRLGEMRADERKIKQIVLNLLSNAIKFTPEGGRIDVRALPVEGGVEVSVSDTGVGIAPEDQDAVFEEFRQVGTSPGKQEGTGLGLTLCRKFVELHGGRIGVKSHVGAGSTFTFVVPVRPGA